MVAHAWRGNAGFAVGGAYQIHQPRAGPISRGIKARGASLRALLTEAGNLPINKSGIFLCYIFIANFQAFQNVGWKIGNKYIGLAQQGQENLPAFRRFNIQSDAALITVILLPDIVKIQRHERRCLVGITQRVATARRFYFYHIGAKVGKNRGAARAENIGGHL